MSGLDAIAGEDGLPAKPSRDNYAYDCTTTARDASLPAHISPCTCESHDGVCQECGYKITVGPSGTEYGHARATNRRADADGVRRDFPHRPSACNPGEEHAWPGYDDRNHRVGYTTAATADAPSETTETAASTATCPEDGDTDG